MNQSLRKRRTGWSLVATGTIVTLALFQSQKMVTTASAQQDNARPEETRQIHKLQDDWYAYATRPSQDSDRSSNTQVIIRAIREAKLGKNVERSSELIARLKEITREQFQAREARRQTEIDAIEERLAKLKVLMEERSRNAELIVELRVKKLLGEKTILDWDNDSVSSEQAQLAMDDDTNIPFDEQELMGVESEGENLEGMETSDGSEGMEEPASEMGAETDGEESEMDKEINTEIESSDDVESEVENTDNSSSVLRNAIVKLNGELRSHREKREAASNRLRDFVARDNDLSKRFKDARDKARQIAVERDVIVIALKELEKVGSDQTSVFQNRLSELTDSLTELEAQGKVIREQADELSKQGKAAVTVENELKEKIAKIQFRLDQLRLRESIPSSEEDE